MKYGKIIDTGDINYYYCFWRLSFSGMMILPLGAVIGYDMVHEKNSLEEYDLENIKNILKKYGWQTINEGDFIGVRKTNDDYEIYRVVDTGRIKRFAVSLLGVVLNHKDEKGHSLEDDIQDETTINDLYDIVKKTFCLDNCEILEKYETFKELKSDIRNNKQLLDNVQQEEAENLYKKYHEGSGNNLSEIDYEAMDILKDAFNFDCFNWETKSSFFDEERIKKEVLALKTKYENKTITELAIYCAYRQIEEKIYRFDEWLEEFTKRDNEKFEDFVRRVYDYYCYHTSSFKEAKQYLLPSSDAEPLEKLTRLKRVNFFNGKNGILEDVFKGSGEEYGSLVADLTFFDWHLSEIKNLSNKEISAAAHLFQQ